MVSIAGLRSLAEYPFFLGLAKIHNILVKFESQHKSSIWEFYNFGLFSLISVNRLIKLDSYSSYAN